MLDSMDKSNSAIADMVTTSQNTRQNLEQIMGNSRDDLKNYRSTLTQSSRSADQSVSGRTGSGQWRNVCNIIRNHTDGGSAEHDAAATADQSG